MPPQLLHDYLPDNPHQPVGPILRAMGELIRSGVRVDALNDTGMPVLYWAVVEDRHEIVEYLIGNGADVKFVDIYEDTLLHMCESGRMTEYLITCGLDVNSVNGNGRTPLHKAVWNKHSKGACEQVTSVLVNHGALLDVQTPEGRTAMHIVAFHNGSKHVLRLLFEKGASISIQDSFGKTAVDYVMANDRDPDYPCRVAILFAQELDRRARMQAFLMLQHDRPGPRGVLHGAPIETIQAILELADLTRRR
jgi:ankyrin repeat protein